MNSNKNTFRLIFEVSTVFIGTIVGAGLASGQEITQFFSTYGFKSFYGLLITAVFYIIFCSMMVSISLNFKLNSYTDFITLVSPGFLGKITDYLTSFFLISSSAIILAGSGALLYQYFAIPKYIGILIMVCLALITLYKDTNGLIAINSFIVPSLTFVIITIFTLYIVREKNIITIENLRTVPIYKNLIIKDQWIISSILYAGFNMMFSSGVLVPLSKELKKKSHIIIGVIIGALVLTLIGFLINSMLLVNIPSIFSFEIPLMHVASRFGTLFQVMLLIIIWCEMFSTEVSDIYSVGKTLENKYKIPYKKGILIVVALALPISQIGFKKLITFLYPAFGIISVIFMIQCIIFYTKMKKEKNS